MSRETVEIVSIVLCVLLVIAIILRRKAKGKRQSSDEF
jgi:cbb3-type cytochrome oxidase subunit 3